MNGRSVIENFKSGNTETLNYKMKGNFKEKYKQYLFLIWIIKSFPFIPSPYFPILNYFGSFNLLHCGKPGCV